MEIMGWGFVADGVPEVQKAAREALRTGSTQLKLMAGGGVSSYFDPLDTTQYTLEEMKAIVTEARSSKEFSPGRKGSSWPNGSGRSSPKN